MTHLRKSLFVIIFLLSQLMCAGAIASLSDGRAAYESGDITKALDSLKPIADEKGLLSLLNSREDVAEASLLLSEIYIEGPTEYFDFTAGKRYLDKSIEFGSLKAIEFHADLILRRNDLMAFDLQALQALIDQGKARGSQFAVYFEEVLRVSGFYKSKSIKPDCALLQDLFENGVTEALISLAGCASMEGDSKEALLLLEKALELKVPMAEFALGGAYETGNGVTPNMPRALAFYEEGIKKTPDGSRDMGNYYSNMGWLYCDTKNQSGIPQDEARGRELLEKAAGMQAGYRYGWALFYGRCGFPVDEERGLKVISDLVERFPRYEIYKADFILHGKAAGYEGQIAELTNMLEGWSRRDDTSAIYLLGHIYHNGLRGLRNEKKGLEYYENCIKLDKNDTRCLGQAGRILLGFSGAGSSDETRALEYLGRAADAGTGSGYAQAVLGERYFKNGDFKQAYFYLEKCSDAGSAWCTGMLGSMYHVGKGVEIDYEMAAKFYTQALELDTNRRKSHGSEVAFAGINLFHLHGESKLKDSSIDVGISILEELANAGDPTSPQVLGDTMFYGTYGMPVDKSQAFDWYEKGYQAGDPMSALDLAQFYKQASNSQGIVEKDVEKYFSLISFAADEGLVNAQAELSIAYCQGIGTKKNFQKSKEMTIKAVKQKYWLGLEQHGLRHYFGTCSDIDKPKAFVLFSLAGNYNTPKGKNNASVVASELDATELEIAKGLLAKCISELTEICF